MKILQVIQRPQLRGAEIFACQLSVEMKQLGHEVDILYLFDHVQFDLDFDLHFFPLNANPSRRFFDFSAFAKLNSIIRSGGYDVVMANAGDTLKYTTLSKKMYGWKTPLVFRNANKMSDFIRSKSHKWLNNFLLSGTDHIISVSENCRRDIIELYPKANLMSTTSTIGTFIFDNVTSIKIEKEPPVWINVGSFVPEKNHGFLISMFAEYRNRNAQGELWLVGDGILKSELMKQVEQLNLSNYVKFWGYRKDVISILKAADIMVMPSKIEGLPGVILEALSCGIPVVASKVGGIPEVIQDGVNGYCIEHYDHNDYLERISNILSDKHLYSRMSDSGKRVIEDKFLMSQIAKAFEEIFSKVIFK